MRLLILVIPLLWVGCQPIKPNENAASAYFDLPGFANNILANQVGAERMVNKTTQVNELSETKNIAEADSTFWAAELLPLLNGNINKPSLMGAYAVKQGVTEPSSNLLKTIYTALPESITVVKKVEVKYLNNPTEIRQVIALIDTKNPVYNTQQLVKLWVNKHGNTLLIDSLIIEGYNKTLLLDSMLYSSKTVVIH